MKITVIGCGYVGLSTGVALAYVGHNVAFVDVDEQKIQGLQAGQAPFFEPSLDGLLKVTNKHCYFTTSYQQALAESEIAFLAVGTPATTAGHANLTYLFAAVTDLIKCSAESLPTIVIKSTVPVGTAKEIQSIIMDQRPYAKTSVVNNPEFLRQGRALHDTLYPERIVIGSDDEIALQELEQLYTPILKQNFPAPSVLPRPQHFNSVPLLCTNPESAELAKYAANAFLATKISFANEIANVCDAVGADVEQVMAVLSHDSRIGSQFLRAGLGYGGSCFPKDTRALAYISNRGGYSFKLLSAVIEVNNSQRFLVIEKLEQILGNLHNKEIALLGLTFKPNTDDLRDAPSLDIAQELLLRGAQVRAHDPVALDKAGDLIDSRVILLKKVEHVFQGADGIILVTEWPQYKTLNWTQLGKQMRQTVIIDGRNALNPDEITNAGFTYRAIGRSQL